MNVEFNPAYVKQYRLIGFDNKVGALRDSMSIVEGGEIGSGFSLIALFEIVPTEENKTAIKTFKSGDKFSEILLDYQKPENDKLVFHDHYAGKFEYTPPHILEKFYQFRRIRLVIRQQLYYFGGRRIFPAGKHHHKLLETYQLPRRIALWAKLLRDP